MIRFFGRNKSNDDNELEDYLKYHLTFNKWCMAAIIGMLGTVCMSAIFYRNNGISVAAGIAGILIGPQIYKKRLINTRKQQLSVEFKDALYSLIVSLRAGRSVEGAFAAAIEDLDPVMTPLIYKEWDRIVKQLQVGFSVEERLEDLGKRSGIEEIRSFARTIAICKRTEGDVVRVMESTIQLIQERMEIQTELEVMLTKKKTEQKILNFMPFVVIGLLLVMSPDYLAPLYDCLQGQIIMTVCVGLTCISYVLSKKISDIAL